MSKRSRTTLTFSVRMPLPPGATAAQAQRYTELAVKTYIDYMAGANIIKEMKGLQSAEVLIKIINRETVYL